MRKYILFFICSLFMMFNPVKLQAQGKSKKNVTSVSKINFEKIKFNPFVKKGQKETVALMVSYPDIFPIGFSKDGCFAYITCKGVDGRGGSDVVFTIIDLVTDDIPKKTVYQTEYSSGLDAVKEFIKAEGNAVDEALKETSIEIMNCTWKDFPINHKGKKISVQIEKQDTGKKMYDFLTLLNYEVTAFNEDGGKKTLARKTEQICEDIYVCGYFENPFEQRIAVIIGEEKIGFEGAHEIDYEITGCNLNVWK